MEYNAAEALTEKVAGRDTLCFRISEAHGRVTVMLDGELDIVSLPDTAMALELAMTRGLPVTLDCSRVNFADAASLRYLRDASERARSAGSDLTIAGAQGIFLKLLQITDSPLVPAPRSASSPWPGLRAVSVAHGRGAILRAATATAGRLAGAPRANSQLADQKAGQLHIVAQQGFDRPFLRFFATVDDSGSACGTALETGGSVWIPDVARSPVFSRGATRVMLDAGAESVCSVPVRAPGGELIAVISAHPTTPVTWENVTKYQMERLALVTAHLIGQHQRPQIRPA